MTYYPKRSPNVLLLHSVWGTGTNFFPLPAAAVEIELRPLLSGFEWRHAEAFPSLLKIYARIVEQLRDNMDSIDHLNGVSFHRVVDNKDLYLDVNHLWIALNYQLLHMLDFLPEACWSIPGNLACQRFTCIQHQISGPYKNSSLMLTSLSFCCAIRSPTILVHAVAWGRLPPEDCNTCNRGIQMKSGLLK